MGEPTFKSSRVFGMYTSLCYTLVTDSNITSAYMDDNRFEQQPQVSKFQKVTPLLLIPTYAIALKLSLDCMLFLRNMP